MTNDASLEQHSLNRFGDVAAGVEGKAIKARMSCMNCTATYSSWRSIKPPHAHNGQGRRGDE
jgi:hypothetical protein